MKILDISHYYVDPPRSGGQLRIFNLNKEIGKKHIVTQFSFTPALIFRKKNKHNNYTEYINIDPFYFISSFILARIFRVPYDFPVDYLFRFKKASKKLKSAIKEVDIIQVEHPWVFSWIQKNAKGKPIVLVEHNFEYELQKEGYKKLPKLLQNLIFKSIKRIEQNAVIKADLIFATSDTDKKNLEKFYNTSDKIKVIENGVDTSFSPSLNRNQIKKKFGFENKKIILFTGAGHPPNYKAIKIIKEKIAPAFKEGIFLIAGSVHKKGREKNLFYTGSVEDIKSYFDMADVAINPMLSGSGTNLKMLEYLSFGLPVITTKVGARGFSLKNNKDSIICNIEDFSKNIKKILRNKYLYAKLKKNGKIFVKNFDWQIIAEKAIENYNLLLRK
ncbi:hypothetical protein CL621_03185 [archaeon]|nr:hypothetical protein [archaeon]|tara:strand:- start:3203 stop:4363 length:1161 start_codon:yes stop_codon:yes gene_type:complete